MLRGHTLTFQEKVFHCFLHDFGRVAGLAHGILENIESEQLAHILDALLRIHHEHRYQKIHEALWYLSFLVQKVRMRMVLEEFCVAWFQRKITEIAVGIHSCVERWRSKRQHEQENSQREYVCRFRFARLLRSPVDFWCHVQLGSHLPVYKLINTCCKAEIAKFESSVFGN